MTALLKRADLRSTGISCKATKEIDRKFNILFIGMNVHKKYVVISLADDDRSEVSTMGKPVAAYPILKKYYVIRLHSKRSLLLERVAGR